MPRNLMSLCAAVLACLAVGCCSVAPVHADEVRMTIDLRDKTVRVTNTIAIREKVPVRLVNLGESDAVSLTVRLTDRTGGVVAAQSAWTNASPDDALGVLDLNTSELASWGSNRPPQSVGSFTLGVWDGDRGRLLVNSVLDLQNNPYLPGMPGPSPIGVSYVPKPTNVWAVGAGLYSSDGGTTTWAGVDLATSVVALIVGQTNVSAQNVLANGGAGVTTGHVYRGDWGAFVSNLAAVGFANSTSAVDASSRALTMATGAWLEAVSASNLAAAAYALSTGLAAAASATNVSAVNLLANGGAGVTTGHVYRGDWGAAASNLAQTAFSSSTGASTSAAAALLAATNAQALASTATGTAATAFATSTNALALASTATGTAATALSTSTGALALASTATGTAATALSTSTGALALASTATGTAATALSTSTGALALASTATGTAATALSTSTGALALASTATGTAATALSTSTNALALASTATGTAATALSTSTNAMALASTATGTAATAFSTSTNALALASTATGTAATAFSTSTNALALASTATGTAATAFSTSTTALALASTATGAAATAFSTSTNALALASTALAASSNPVMTNAVLLTGSTMSGELVSPGITIPYTNQLTIRPGVNLLTFWTLTNAIIAQAIPTNGVADWDENLADQIAVLRPGGIWARYQLSPSGGKRWFSMATSTLATNSSDTVCATNWAYYISRSTSNVTWTLPDMVTGYDNVYAMFFGQYANIAGIDNQQLYRVFQLWLAYVSGELVQSLSTGTGLVSSRTGSTVYVSAVMDTNLAALASNAWQQATSAVSLATSSASAAAFATNALTNALARTGDSLTGDLYLTNSSKLVLGGGADGSVVVQKSGGRGFELYFNRPSAQVSLAIVTNGANSNAFRRIINGTTSYTMFDEGNFNPSAYVSVGTLQSTLTNYFRVTWSAPASFTAAGSQGQAAVGRIGTNRYLFIFDPESNNWPRVRLEDW